MKDAGNRNSRDIPQKATVSGRWLVWALGFSLGGAVLCIWIALCFAFWWGSWQLLYQPAADISLTPANKGLAFDPVKFAATDAGVPRLSGWWIPAEQNARFNGITIMYLHGTYGNLSNTLNALTPLHVAGVNVLAIDYRGYGQSQFARPREAHWREDTDWTIQHLTGTRHVAAGSIVLAGSDLGANLALEVAAVHPELAGVVVKSPEAKPMDAAFSDAPKGWLPVRLLLRDRFDLNAAAQVCVPVLWIEAEWPTTSLASKTGAAPQIPEAYSRISAPKTLVGVNPAAGYDQQVEDALAQWLTELHAR
jgi:pimeloyl-ACP methyl ester carboxylesterase